MSSISEAIERLHDDDDSAFEPLMRAICAASLIVAVRPYESTDDGVDFLSFVHEGMDYIPLFATRSEFDEFYGEGEAEGEYKAIEIEGKLLAESMAGEQFLMINPMTGGIMFQGAHLKPFIGPANQP
jgi:hypothetical protein